MNKTVINTLLFTAGAAIGSVVTWKILKVKYEHITQEEIYSVREEYDRLSKMMKKEIDMCRNITELGQNESEKPENVRENKEDSNNFVFTEQEKIGYSNIANKYRVLTEADTSDDENDKEGENGDEVPYINGPYVISPDEFNSSPPGYNAQPLDYFVDGILADNWGVQLALEETIGEDALEHFGEYVDDIVYVRNEREEIDYEVTRDPRTYAESIRTNPSYNQ